MSKINVNPTRMELARLKKLLFSSTRGHKLLKDKQDELMRRFLDYAKEAKSLRAEVFESIQGTRKNLFYASLEMGERELKAALLNRQKAAGVLISEQNVMGVRVPVFEEKKESGTGLSYSLLESSVQLDMAAESLFKMRGKLFRLAALEKAALLIAGELEKTRRRVNALEHTIIPDYLETIKYITMRLEENERAASIRLLKVKEMAHNKKA